MSKRNKQSFIQGAIVLSLSALIVKLIGAFFKLPLNHVLGGEGMGYFSSAYTIFNLFTALAIAGLPVAISKMVSERVALGRYRDVRKILGTSFLLFSCLGILSTAIMAVGAKYFVEMLHNPGAYYSILALSPSIFFICIMSIYKGYYQGLSNMVPTAISQIIEALIKLIFGLGIAYFFIQKCTAEYSVSQTIFERPMENSEVAQDFILQIGAAGAVLGITFSTFVGMVYLFFRHLRKKDGITKKMLKESPAGERKGVLLKQLIGIMVPVSLAAVVINITSIIDLGSIMTRLTIALSEDSNTILTMYRDALPPGITLDKIPNFLYGSYSGMAITIYNLIPSLTVALGVSALPAITVAFASKDEKGLAVQVSGILKMTALVAIPAGIGLMTMSYPILRLLFETQSGEILVAAPLLSSLGVAVVFVAISTPLNSILQGIGRVDLPVKLMVLGGLIKLGINYVLVAIPGINIKGAPIGTVVCYIFIVSVSIYILVMTTGIRINLVKVFGKPLFAGLACGVFAKLTYNLLSLVISSKYIVIPSIALGVVSYIVVLLFTRTLEEGDLLMLPNGQKMVQKFRRKGYIR